MTVQNNLWLNAAQRHIDVPGCWALRMDNNLIWSEDGRFSVRVGTDHGDVEALDAQPWSSGTLSSDPMLGDGFLPASGSPAIDSGVDLGGWRAALEGAYGGDAGTDAELRPRPVGAWDRGAVEQ